MPNQIDINASGTVRAAKSEKAPERTNGNGRALSPERLAAVVQAAYLLEVRNR